MSYNKKLDDFIESVKDKDRIEIFQIAQREIAGAESGLSGVKGAVAKRASGAPEYVAILKGFMFVFMTGGRPSMGEFEEEFQKFKPIIESLVKKGQFKPEILSVFE
jgi:hypothetical protein